MLNRIRRAVSLTRERHFPKGRHRRRLTSIGPSPAYAPLAPTEGPTTVRGRCPDRANMAGSLAGEDIALVRPYVLAWEKRERPRRSMAMAPHLPSEAWSVLGGVR
ncbi:hypothetical protein CP966_02940 [Streptomyces galilaeus]|nr:hypothetical protein CP966_02940 [Streptomyces galilaeus]GGW59126.1 hypothetical protein GCM10010350_49490 [Streptomyces galilaeus]